MTTPSSDSSDCPCTESCIEFTTGLVNWDALASLACELHQVESFHWGNQLSGGYNLVRFLHLHDHNDTIFVARVPLRSEDNMSAEHDSVISNRISSEVATMEYVESHTNIPLPHVFHHSAHAEGDVRSPYILMSKVEGVALCTIWDDMDDDKRQIVLRQVIDILLELWSHRFDKKGMLFKKPGGGKAKDDWYIGSNSLCADPNETGSRHRIVTTSYADSADYWLAYTNANIRDECDARFGHDAKRYFHSIAWFMRSMVPALFDPSLDTEGCPLLPGDFHSQNIMITDVATNPRITAVIDWELSGPDFVTSFAQYPLFIVDHPAWDDDHPLRKRNIRDRATFDELLCEAERTGNHNQFSGLPLSQLISNSYPIYLFSQMMYYPITASVYNRVFFSYVFGDSEDFSVDYYSALIYKGILQKYQERFEKERKVLLEAREVLGRDVVGFGLTITQFKCLVLENIDRFDSEGSVVGEWLASVN